jgi:CRISPR-associated protein Cmr2
MAKYALLFTIGGVQDFIASARKINDLWSGSYMVSYLTAQGIKALPSGYEMIFPNKNNPLINDKYDEKIFKTSLPNKFLAKFETENIGDTVKKIEDSIKDAYKELRGAELDKLQKQDDWIECYWSACEVKDASNIDLQQKLSKELTFTKMFKTLKNDFNSEEGFKCTLCGLRETLDNAGITADWYSADLKDDEKLCSVCAAKRNLMKRISKKYTIETANNYGISTQDIGDSMYYAVIVIDGDHMGNWMKGKIDPALTPDKTSEKLMNFSNKIWHSDFFNANQKEKKLLEAKLIYCGGDDVLCLAPINKAIDTADKIQKLFKEQFDSKATMSAGIHISHGKDSLSMALDNARASEKESKDQGRNRFTISVDKRAGDFVSWTGKWEHVPNLVTIIDYFEKEILSPAFSFQLKTEFFNFEQEFNENMTTAIKDRIQYQLNRHYDTKKEKNLNEKEHKYNIKQCEEIINAFSFSSPSDLKYFFNFLEISIFFARQQKKHSKQ